MSGSDSRPRRYLRPIKQFSKRLLRNSGTRREAMAVVGYAARPAVVAGATLDLHLAARTAGPKTLRVERVGRTGLGAELEVDLRPLAAPAQAWLGYDWPVTASFVVPSEWPSGLYGILHDGQAILSFVVLPAVPAATSRLLCHVPILTAAAYDPAGGKSLYGFNSAPNGNEADRATTVSLHRPSAWDPLGYSDSVRLSSFVEWLDDEGVVVEFCSSLELDARPDLLDSYDCLILAGHDEYWTVPMRDNAERFVAQGGNLVVLSGNTCYRVVRLDDERRRVHFYKYAASDPTPDAREVTVAWADPPVNRPQNTFIGSGCTHGAMEGEPSPYTVRFPDHWVFAGLDTPRTTSAFMTYESDAAAYVDEPEGYPRVTGEDATPLTCTVLATADLRTWAGKPGRATITLFTRGGSVFNVGTTDWLDVLGDDPIVTQVTRNVLARLCKRHAPAFEDIGSAPGVIALTATRDRLFAATRDGRLVRRFAVGAEVPWHDFGAVGDAVALAAEGDTLYLLTRDNVVLYRSTVERDEQWTVGGPGPDGGATALGALGGMLYATDAAGAAWQTPAARAEPAWRRAPLSTLDTRCTALCSLGGILIGATADGRLLRSRADHISAGTPWQEVEQAGALVGVGSVESTLFGVTPEHRLVRLDLSGLRTG